MIGRYRVVNEGGPASLKRLILVMGLIFLAAGCDSYYSKHPESGSDQALELVWQTGDPHGMSGEAADALGALGTTEKNLSSYTSSARSQPTVDGSTLVGIVYNPKDPRMADWKESQSCWLVTRYDRNRYNVVWVIQGNHPIHSWDVNVENRAVEVVN